MPLGQPYVQADSPRTIPLAMPWWYRADAVTLVGSKASVLKDLSGNGYDALQSTDINRLAWSATSGPNNTPGLTGAGAQYAAPVNPIILGGATQLTNVYVITPATIATAAVIAANGNSVIPPGSWQDAWLGISSQYQGSHVNGASASVWRCAGTNATPTIVEITHDLTVPTEQTILLINGILVAQVSIVDQNVTGVFADLPLVIASRPGFAIPWIGVIAEAFEYIGLLSAQQRQNLYRGYLSPRYGIAVP